ncbi:MAG: hypothetical protein ACK4IS_04295 [Erythrobacter sp.]
MTTIFTTPMRPARRKQAAAARGIATSCTPRLPRLRCRWVPAIHGTGFIAQWVEDIGRRLILA